MEWGGGGRLIGILLEKTYYSTFKRNMKHGNKYSLFIILHKGI